MTTTIQSPRDLKPGTEAESTFRRWVSHLNEEFTRHPSVDRRSEIVRDELYQLFLGRPHGGKLNATLVSELASNTLFEGFDPRNVTLEPEYDGEIDYELYAPRKPLVYFWQMFDRSPLGLNYWLGLRFRHMIALHVFKHVGKGVRIYPHVDFTFGYNITLEDNCSIGRGAYLDDRHALVLSAGTQVAPHSRIVARA
ncbi:MAG TPA: hypothetical protein VGC07_07940 [Granulicella sp.]